MPPAKRQSEGSNPSKKRVKKEPGTVPVRDSELRSALSTSAKTSKLFGIWLTFGLNWSRTAFSFNFDC